MLAIHTSVASEIIVALIALVGVIYQGRKTRNRLDTGNGHTIGQGVARIEETLWRHENRLDAIEVEIREASARVDTTAVLSQQSVQQMEDHLLEIAPLREWVQQQITEEEG